MWVLPTRLVRGSAPTPTVLHIRALESRFRFMDLRKLRQVDLAALLKVTPRQIHNLVKQGMPSFVDDDGKRKYDGPECVAWFIQRQASDEEDLGDVDAARV